MDHVYGYTIANDVTGDNDDGDDDDDDDDDDGDDGDVDDDEKCGHVYIHAYSAGRAAASRTVLQR